MSKTATQPLPTPTLSPVIPALIAQISLTIALLLFIRDLWTLTPLDSALMTTGGTGAGIYALLMGGYTIVKRVMAHTPPKEDDPATAEESPAAQPSPQPGQPAPEREPVAHAAEAPAPQPAPPIPA